MDSLKLIDCIVHSSFSEEDLMYFIRKDIESSKYLLLNVLNSLHTRCEKVVEKPTEPRLKTTNPDLSELEEYKTLRIGYGDVLNKYLEDCKDQKVIKEKLFKLKNRIVLEFSNLRLIPEKYRNGVLDYAYDNSLNYHDMINKINEIKDFIFK